MFMEVFILFSFVLSISSAILTLFLYRQLSELQQVAVDCLKRDGRI